MTRTRQDITQLIDASRAGDTSAEAELLAFVYDDLRAMARRQLAGEVHQSTLSATALVNEAYLRLAGSDGLDVNDRAHFFRLVRRTMRRIAVDHARTRLAAKRGGGEHPVALEGDVEDPADERAELVLNIEDALTQLREEAPRLVDVVESRFFLGMTESETAELLGVSRPTVARDWERAKKLLQKRLA